MKTQSKRKARASRLLRSGWLKGNCWTSLWLSIACGNHATTVTATVPPAFYAVKGSPRFMVRQRNIRTEFALHALELDPADGGRIIEFSFKGDNILVSKDESPEGYGSSFWPSPRRDWPMLPPAEFDKLPWKAAIDGASTTLESRVAQRSDLLALQRTSPIPDSSAIAIEYRITNHANVPRLVAPWQITRVRAKGITFYPSQEPSFAESSLTLTPSDGIVWYTHVPSEIEKSVQSLADSQEGWVAHTDGHLLFVEVFPDVARGALAPGEAELIIHAHGSGRFVEIGQQGPYTELAPGKLLTWQIYWVLQPIADDIEVRAGNPQLVAMARRLACSVRPAG